MIDPEKLAAFALMSAAASLIPGPSMLFVMGQAIWRSGRSGAAALAGVQFGYVWWWVLAALGLGTLAVSFPIGFRILAVGGALYLAWLGFTTLRSSGDGEGRPEHTRKRSAHAFRDGVLVAMTNPKSLIYIVALLPPFVNPRDPIVPQLVLLAVIAMAIDLALGLGYILAGKGISRAMAQKVTRTWIDRSVGSIFLIISGAILADLLLA